MEQVGHVSLFPGEQPLTILRLKWSETIELMIGLSEQCHLSLHKLDLHF